MSVQLLNSLSGPVSAAEVGFDGIRDAHAGLRGLPIGRPSNADGISRMLPQPGSSGLFGGDVRCGGLMEMLESLLAQLSQLLRGLGGAGGPMDGESYLRSANGGSTGDPHLAFNGQTWDSMQSQRDLVHSTSIPGGYRVATQTTAPNAQGVTWNQSATVYTNDGMTGVRLDNNGNATYDRYGVVSSIAPGQTIQGPNGETIARSQDGSIAITARDEEGGSITTTLRNAGQGVDVNVQSSNLMLGGTLVDRDRGQPGLLPPLYPF